MIDPTIWANTPGMGRAPLLPTPQAVQAPSDSLRALALRLLPYGGEGPTALRERPIGAVVRDPAGLTQAQQINELQALGGFPSAGAGMATRAPAAGIGMLGGMAAGVPGLGYGLSKMAEAGVQQRQRNLAGELTQNMADAMERGTQARDQRDLVSRSQGFVNAYEAGRQAAVRQGGGQRSDQRDIEGSQRSRDVQPSIAI